MRRPVAASVVLAAALAAVFPSAAPARLRATVTSKHPGWVAVRVAGGPPRSLVTVREGSTVLGQVKLGRRGRGTAGRVTAWLCDRRQRSFVIDAGAAGAVTATASTPSCNRRVRVRAVPRRPHAGRPMTVRLKDRWGFGGLYVRLCLASPAGTTGCGPVQVGTGAAAVRMTAPRAGEWYMRVQGGWIDITRRLRVRPIGRRLNVMVAGDSMVERPARHLRRMLKGPRVRVRTDIHYGAGISNPFGLDWREEARAVVARRRPDVVILLLGGTEGWALGSTSCCGAAWIGEYAARVREVMVTLLQQGAAQVYWMTLPAPADPRRVKPLRAANAALARAVQGLEPWARLVDITSLLTPGFVYRESTLIDGVVTPLRMPDGMHLSHPGALMAVHAVEDRLRLDAVLPPGARRRTRDAAPLTRSARDSGAPTPPTRRRPAP
jgi:hypothetical protein